MLDCHVSARLIRPGRVMGRRLHHPTLAHYWLLEAVDSPYPFGRQATYSECVFACLICSLPAWAGRWLVMRPVLLRAALAAWRVRLFWRPLNPFREMAEFQAYWTAYSAMPEPIIKARESAGEPSCLPSSVNIAWAIMDKVGEARAWSMPLPLALCYFTAESERNGRTYRTEWMKEAARDNAIAEAEQRRAMEGVP